MNFTTSSTTEDVPGERPAQAQTTSGGRASIGIVIPTYNRQNHLLECLRHLERQTCKDFVVSIIDDGSTDSTCESIANYQLTASFPLRYDRQTNRGQAVGRNRAIAQLETPLCILIGDDIFPAPDFVRVHLELHREHPELEVVGLGLTLWSEEGQVVTPFMRWAGWDGVQFIYAGLMDGEAPSWKHFYTSNLSFKTAYLRQNPFHEGFRRYGMEDIELGYRLAAEHGLRMYFVRNAVASHLHPTTFRGICRRMLDAGEGAYLFEQLWPERRPPAFGAVKGLLLRVLTERHVMLPLLAWIGDLSLRFRCPNPLIKRVLFLHELAGRKRAAARALAQGD